ncbi:MAG: LysR family transcriptional regulator [Myxococcota bacterium]
MHDRFDLEDLICFVRVVDLGGISAAARSLGRSKQTVSRRLHALEQDLDVRLLERSTRSVRPTPTGQRLYGAALAVVSAAHHFVDLTDEVKHRPSGVLRIASPPLFARRFLAPVVEEFLANHPDACVHLELELRHERLVEANLDLAFRIGPLEDSSAIARRIGAASIVCVGSPAYLDATRRPEHPEDLRDRPFVAYGRAPHRTTQARYIFTRGSSKHEVAVQGRLQVNSHEIAHSACRAGLALAVLPWIVVEDDVRSGVLEHLLPDWPIPLVDLYLLRPSRPTGGATVDAFLELVEPILEAAPWNATP